MVHVVRKLALSRRTFLRGSGAALALPWLDAMQPALTAAPTRPLRSVFVFLPNGVRMDRWTPAATGKDFELPHTLAPLAAVRDTLTIHTHLALDAGRSHGDGPGDHARATATYLTCAHPKRTGGRDLRVGVSIDQQIAANIGEATTYPSLEFGMEGGRRAGRCDSGYSCAYLNNISWRTPTTPVAKEVNPRAAFRRLTGGGVGIDPADARGWRRMRSVLDAALEDARQLRKRLGTTDQAKLDEYLDAVRDVEKRLQRAERQAKNLDLPEGFWERPDTDRSAAHVQLMYDLIVLALRTDTTRVATFMLGNGGSGRTYRFLGVTGRHHPLSHHRGDKKKIAQIGKIDRFHIEQFARFLTALRATQDAGSDLLRSSLVQFGSGIGDGNRHNHLDLPILIAGGGGGKHAPRGHVEHAKRTPLANLYLGMLHAHGIAAKRFGDSTKPLL